MPSAGAATIPEFVDLRSAHELLKQHVDRTPTKTFPTLNEALGCEVWLKCDHFQRGGSFKLRGASHAIARLSERGDRTPVATHSSGNHGAALALAARADDRRAQVVMPADAVPGKIDAVRSYGATVVLCEPGQRNREAGLARLVADGHTPIPPYDHPDIIAGQGTAAIELIEDAPELDALITPLGGGGLLSGSAIAGRALHPGLKVYGAEPAGAADAHASLAQGKRVTDWQPETFADGLRAVVGVMNFQIIQTLVDQILLADDQAIERAMRLVLDHTALRIEPSSAVALAAIQRHPALFAGKRVGVVVTGGNIDLGLFPWMATDGDV